MSLQPSRQSELDTAIRRHSDTVRRALHTSGLSKEDSEDALQDVLSIFVRRFDDVEAGARRAFLVKVAWRVAADQRRKKNGQPSPCARLPEPEDAAATSLDARLDERRAHGYAIEALSVMPSMERSLFVSAHWDGKSRALLASELGIPEGTVASRLSRANGMFDAAVRLAQYHERERARAGCSLPARAPGRNQVGVSSFDRGWEKLQHGGARYVNNQWARARARGNYDQCLLTRDLGRLELGWSWSWPKECAAPYAFPQASIGWSPWHGGASTDPRLPVSLARLGRLRLSYDAQTCVVGPHTLLLVVSLVHSARFDGASDPGLFSAELCVVLDHTGDVVPSGTVAARVEVDGVRYDLWRSRLFGGPDLLGYPAFVAAPSVRRRAGTLDVHALLSVLTRKRWISDQLSVTSLELGNEIWGGSGTTWLRRLDLELGLK
jgi:RNA polymerase sigma factor (sigma-70 family)